MNEELEAMTSEEASPVEQETEAAVEAETGETETPEAEPPAASEQADSEIESLKSQIKAFQTKAADEVGKRQKLEQQLQQLQQAQEQGEKPDFFEDPDAAISQLQEKIKHEIQHEMSQVSLATSEMFGRMKYDDFIPVLDAVNAMQETDPAGLRQILSQATPGIEYGISIYDAYKNYQATKQVEQAGGVSALMDKIAELESKLAAKPQTQIPPDLTTARNAGGDEQATEIADGNEGLESLLGR
jgi:hypothetical protein